jgi:hypothetical protein
MFTTRSYTIGCKMNYGHYMTDSHNGQEEKSGRTDHSFYACINHDVYGCYLAIGTGGGTGHKKRGE